MLDRSQNNPPSEITPKSHIPQKGEDDSRDADEIAVLGLLHSTNLDI